MKKKFTMILVIISVLTTFVGCDGDNIETQTTNTLPVVENFELNYEFDREIAQEVVEYTEITNDDYYIVLENTYDLFKIAGENSTDISISIKNLQAFSKQVTDLEKQAIDLGEINEGNLYYVSDENLLSLNIITDINSNSNDVKGSIGGEKISIDYDLNENKIIRNDSTEFFYDTINNSTVITDVITNVYEYAKTQVEFGETNETNETNETLDDYEVQIATLVDTVTSDEVDVTNTQTEIPVVQIPMPDNKDELDAQMSDPNNYHSYNGSSVVELYAYDINNYIMTEFDILPTNLEHSDIIDALNENTNTEPKDFGYFIKTYNFETKEAEKHYVFIDETNELLLDTCKETLNNSFKYASWTKHMSEENISSIRFSYMANYIYGDKNEQVQGNGEVTDIEQIANELKVNLTVDSFDSVKDGKVVVIPNSSSNYHNITIEFKNDVIYSIQLLGDTLQIYTSDLDKTVTYTLAPATSAVIRTIMERTV